MGRVADVRGCGLGGLRWTEVKRFSRAALTSAPSSSRAGFQNLPNPKACFFSWVHSVRLAATNASALDGRRDKPTQYFPVVRQSKHRESRSGLSECYVDSVGDALLQPAAIIYPLWRTKKWWPRPPDLQHGAYLETELWAAGVTIAEDQHLRTCMRCQVCPTTWGETCTWLAGQG